MIVKNLTNSALGLKGVSIPPKQSRTVRGFDRNGNRERTLLANGHISIPEAEKPAVAEPLEPRRGFFGGIREEPEDESED